MVCSVCVPGPEYALLCRQRPPSHVRGLLMPSQLSEPHAEVGHGAHSGGLLRPKHDLSCRQRLSCHV